MVIHLDRLPAGLVARARGSFGAAARMNKTEAEFELVLKSRPAVTWIAYEGITLLLAHDTRYTPDFATVTGGELVFYEVKGGFRREDAWVKLKTAARLFPFRFVLATREAGSWTEEDVPG